LKRLRILAPFMRNVHMRRLCRAIAATCAALVGLVAIQLRAQSIVFDFNDALAHTPLPIDSTRSGITAHFSASGQGYSIQDAGVLGFTPAGFTGNAIYPNSVYAADLMVGFSKQLTSFSIMYAPEEYACDSSATLRVTGYLGATFVATATTTAPVPGTWPTGVLTLNPSRGFDNVVVHYDSGPPTGGDWGPIFMADNMVVIPDAIFANGFE
jgi:hypothetical protein